MLPAPPELLEQAERLARPGLAVDLSVPLAPQEAPGPPGLPAILARLDLAALAQLVLRALRVPPERLLLPLAQLVRQVIPARPGLPGQLLLLLARPAPQA